MKGSLQGKAQVQRLRVIAAECRAAAKRVRMAVLPSFCYTVIRNEAQRHEALLEGSSLLPAFEVLTSHDDEPVRNRSPDQLQILIRIMTPSSMSTHASMINLCKPTEFDAALIALHVIMRMNWNSHFDLTRTRQILDAVRDRVEKKGEPVTQDFLVEIARKAVDRRSKEPDLKVAPSIDPPEYVVASEGEAADACGFVSDALIAMAEHLDFRIRSPELVKPRGISGLDTNAKDVLKMLWTLQAFGEKSSKPLKAIAGRYMPTRNRRKTISTLEREAHKGFAELKERGLALARQNVGSWLTVEGRELAESTWGPKARK